LQLVGATSSERGKRSIRTDVGLFGAREVDPLRRAPRTVELVKDSGRTYVRCHLRCHPEHP